MAKPLNIIGDKYGTLTVVGYQGKSKWVCRCDCGNTTIVNTSHLRDGHTRSCGCLKVQSATKHGKSRTRMYHIWVGIKQRCHNERRREYENYGARGVFLCDEWKDGEAGFENFARWSVENGYDESLTIDRIDNNKGYCPSNCRWVTAKEQSNNTRKNTFLTFNGKTQTISQWADETGIKKNTIIARLYKSNWSVEKALTTPVRGVCK